MLEVLHKPTLTLFVKNTLSILAKKFFYYKIIIVHRLPPLRDSIELSFTVVIRIISYLIHSKSDFIVSSCKTFGFIVSSCKTF